MSRTPSPRVWGVNRFHDGMVWKVLRVPGNLLINAIRHNPASGTITAMVALELVDRTA